MQRFFVVTFVVVGLMGAQAFPQSITPSTIPDISALSPSTVSSLLQLFSGLAAQQVKSTPLEVLADSIERVANNGINSISDDQLKIVTNVARESAKDALDLVKSNPELLKQGKELLSEGLENVGKFVAQNPQLIESGLKLLQENPDLQKLLITTLTSVLPLLPFGGSSN